MTWRLPLTNLDPEAPARLGARDGALETAPTELGELVTKLGAMDVDATWPTWAGPQPGTFFARPASSRALHVVVPSLGPPSSTRMCSRAGSLGFISSKASRIFAWAQTTAFAPQSARMYSHSSGTWDSYIGTNAAPHP
jgi:hypothetical protein